MKIDNADRAKAAGVYEKYKAPFLESIDDAQLKELLIRTKNVQVLHGFGSAEAAEAYLSSSFFNQDVVMALRPLLKDTPEVRIYNIA